MYARGSAFSSLPAMPEFAIVEKGQVVDAQMAGCAAQLVLAHLPEGFRRRINSFSDLAHIAVGGAHETDPRAAAGIVRQRSACSKSFIVRMRKKRQ